MTPGASSSSFHSHNAVPWLAAAPGPAYRIAAQIRASM